MQQFERERRLGQLLARQRNLIHFHENLCLCPDETELIRELRSQRVLTVRKPLLSSLIFFTPSGCSFRSKRRERNRSRMRRGDIPQTAQEMGMKQTGIRFAGGGVNGVTGSECSRTHLRSTSYYYQKGPQTQLLFTSMMTNGCQSTLVTWRKLPISKGHRHIPRQTWDICRHAARE